MLNSMTRSALRGCAAAALALTLAACDDEPAPQFEPTGTGSLSGFLYVDVNEDRRYDPSDGDRPLPGVTVQVRSRATSQVIGSATAVTDASGRFTIENLPLGTHDLFIVTDELPEGANVCGNPTAVTVNRSESAFAQIAARVACLISINEAERQPVGTPVLVRGIVTSPGGMVRSDYTFIEDASSGVLIFGGAFGSIDLNIGDLVEVSGTIGQFGGEAQLLNATLRSRTEDAAAVVPQEVTTAQVTQAGIDPFDPLIGRLVVVRKAQLTTTFNSGGNRNATINDGSGNALVRAQSGLVASVSNDTDVMTAGNLSVGKCYDITGIAASFNGAGQIFPRSFSDFVEVPCS